MRNEAELVISYITNPQERTRFRRYISWLFHNTLNVLFGLRIKNYTHLAVCRTSLARCVRPDRPVGDTAAERVWMRELNELTGGNVAGEGVLRAEGDLEAAAASLTGQSRASNLLSGKKMPGARCGVGAMLR